MLSRLLAAMAAPREQMDGSIVSSTIENRGVEMASKVGVAIEGGWGDVCWGRVRIIVWVAGNDSGIMVKNSWCHGLQHPQKWGCRDDSTSRCSH